MNTHFRLALAALLIHSTLAAAGTPSADIARGRYMVAIGGCNDCHTPGYAESGGQVPESDWLAGSPVGFQGPWGTTYASNLRQAVANMDEATWMARAVTSLRPPMPSASLQAMSQDDLRAVYRFIRSLGARGDAAPAYVPPGAPAMTPVINFVPRRPDALAARP